VNTTRARSFATAGVPEPVGVAFAVAFAEDGLLQGGRISRTPAVPAGELIALSTEPSISSDIGGIVPTQTPTGQYTCARGSTRGTP